jgi:MFS family permease
MWSELRPHAPVTKAPRLPFLVRYSLNGRRGPKRVLELVRVFSWAVLLLAGIAAFCAFASFAWTKGDLVALASVAIAVSIVPLLLCVVVFRLRPRHLRPRGSWLVMREVASQGALAFVYSAVVVGIVSALLSASSAQWLHFQVWKALAMVAAWAIGLAVSLVLMALSTAIAYVLAGWILGLVVAAFSLAITVGAFWVFVQQPIGIRELLVFVVPTLTAMLLAVSIVAAAAFYLPRLRRREAGDGVAPARWDNARLARMTEDEDRQFQNHFASVTIVKDGLRLLQLRAVLRFVHLAGKIYYNQGSLGSIPSIHFARFILLKEEGRTQKRLLFLTNYDGGWPNYLGEFSHVPGVTLIWGNTEGFPRPFLLFGDGSRDEQRFKTWARASQVKTLIWYSAYPELSVVQVNRNTRVRLSLARPLDERAPRLGPLLRFWRVFRQPLDEAALDDALRSLTN